MHAQKESARSRRAKWLAAAAATGLVVGGVAFAGSAIAVHDEGFSLNADINGTPTDWVDLFDTTQQPPVPLETLPDGFGAAAFKDDYFLPDHSGYATGTKDTLPISGNQGWQCKTPNNLGAKFDIVNAYAGAMSPSTGNAEGDLIIYFGAEISAPEGNSNVGVWLLKDGGVACSGQGNTDFSGQHRDGDVFVVSAFTGGGVNSNIDVYRWSDPNPDNGTDTDGSLVLAGSFANANCDDDAALAAQSPPDSACAIANTNGDKTEDESLWVTTPWESPTKDGSGILKEAQFFEGGVNLSELGLAGCFSTFLANSRSSQSETSTLHDFATGSFNVCNASLSTQVSDTSLDLGETVSDSATVSVEGLGSPPAPTGDVDFYICGPDATSCDSTEGDLLESVDLASATKDGNDYTVSLTSAYTPTAAGDYCFAAEWSGDENYDGGPYSDDGTNECFTVAPNQPTISTSQTGAPPTGLPLGSKISDTATLGNTANDPDGNPAGGTITFYAYGPQSGNPGDQGYTADCTGTAKYTSAAYTVSGDGTYPTAAQAKAEFQPTVVGTYEWVAVYSGDSPNTLGVSSKCGDEPSLLFALQPTMDTAQYYYPQDSTTVNVATGAGNLTGSVKFEAFEDSACTGTVKYSKTVDKSGNTGQTLTASTDNQTSYKVDGASTTVYWKVTFTSSNTGIKDVTSDCNETSTVTINNDLSASSTSTGTSTG